MCSILAVVREISCWNDCEAGERQAVKAKHKVVCDVYLTLIMKYPFSCSSQVQTDSRNEDKMNICKSQSKAVFEKCTVDFLGLKYHDRLTLSCLILA